MRLMLKCAVTSAVGVLLLSGCGGSDGSDSLQQGVYRFELTEQYLLDHGISAEQAANESGVHETTIATGFSDSWKSANGTTGFCSGTYKEDGDRVTFSWVSGCFGDWAMTYAVDEDTVTWSDIEALPPHDTAEDQNIAEVFNGVPWTRVGDTSANG
jgi:hypothetical protein